MDIGTAQRSYTHSSRHAHEERGVRIRRPLSHLVGSAAGPPSVLLQISPRPWRGAKPSGESPGRPSGGRLP
jgi:hypothetical protein